MRTIALITLLWLALGCEHPAEPDGSAETRAGIPGAGEPASAEAKREKPEPARPGELAATPMPGPRTSTPGGVAFGLHGTTA